MQASLQEIIALHTIQDHTIICHNMLNGSLCLCGLWEHWKVEKPEASVEVCQVPFKAYLEAPLNITVMVFKPLFFSSKASSLVL